MPGPSALEENPRFPGSAPQSPGIPQLDPGRLHEVHAGRDDRAAALAFALSGTRLGEGALFLLRPRGRGNGALRLHGEGLARLGLDPVRLTLVETRDEAALLRAALDAARCPALAGVVVESEGRLAAYDLTASRRLALAAERAGGRIVMVRIEAEPRPSAAFSRWTLASAPSAPLPGGAPGGPVLLARLDRRRGWAAGQALWRLEWDTAHARFRPLPERPEELPAEPALPRPLAPVARLRGGQGNRAA